MKKPAAPHRPIRPLTLAQLADATGGRPPLILPPPSPVPPVVAISDS